MYPIASISDTRTLEDRVVAAGVSVDTLMARAGTEIAKRLTEWSRDRQLATGPVTVMVGPGNNGGDGLICAQRLHDDLERVYIYLWRRSDLDDPLIAGLRQRGVEIALASEDEGLFVLRRWLRHSTWCLDALLGIGANRSLPPDLIAILEEVDSHRPELRLCAVDVPSDALTKGSEKAVQADLTIMLGTFKAEVCGDEHLPNLGSIEVADIGLFPHGVPDEVAQGMRAEDIRAMLPERSDFSHKGTFGRVLCAVGSSWFPGAAVFSASAAARSGSGLVTVASVPGCLAGLTAALPEATHLPVLGHEGTVGPIDVAMVLEAVQRYQSVLVGCGLGHTQASTAFVRELLVGLKDEASIPLVIDADGLNCLATVLDWPSLLPQDTVLTPHLAEMSRLCDVPLAEVAENGMALCVEKAQTWGCHIVLKGYSSFIATPEGIVRALVEPNSALATGGTGDILAGLIAGFRTRIEDALQATCLAVLVLSEAGRCSSDRVGAHGTLATDVLQEVPGVLANNVA